MEEPARQETGGEQIPRTPRSISDLAYYSTGRSFGAAGECLAGCQAAAPVIAIGGPGVLLSILKRAWL